MKLSICRKHLVGKTIAFSNFGTIDAKYYGTISGVSWGKTMGQSLNLTVVNGNFYSVSSFVLGDSIMHHIKATKSSKGGPMVEEPIISGCVPLGRIVREVILREEEDAKKPPVPPTASRLIYEVGTFTGCKKLMRKFHKEKTIRKVGNVLHVDMSIFNPNCICGISLRVSVVEALTRDLKKVFGVEEVVYHARQFESNLTVEVEPGYSGDCNDAGRMKGFNGDSCRVHPVIKGLGMRWEFDQIERQ